MGCFRPLAGKLRAKTTAVHCVDDQVIWFPSPCGEIKGQNRSWPALNCTTASCFRPLAGKLRAKTARTDEVPPWFDCRGFRPLAGKLRAKTLSCGADGHTRPWFPSPCGEIKGQNDMLRLPARERPGSFRPLAGKLRAKTWARRRHVILLMSYVSVPLRGN